jgi:hypothetical protein
MHDGPADVSAGPSSFARELDAFGNQSPKTAMVCSGALAEP